MNWVTWVDENQPMKTAAVFTLGCKVNQVESEAIIEELKRQGYTIVRDGSPAGLCIINTCSVTATSDRKSRSLIRRIARDNPGARIIVTGCLAELEPDITAAIDGVDLVVGNRVKERLVELIGNDSPTEPASGARHIVMSLPGAETAPLARILYDSPHQRTRAFIKIADGCDSYCTYCIIPYARGPVCSKRPEDVVAEIRQLQGIGYREMVLTGINIGLYGRDLLEPIRLPDLLNRIFTEIGGVYRLRLGSINPLEIGPDLLDLLSGEPRLCRHLHIPLQSGSDRVLNAMGRNYSGVFYRQLLEQIAGSFPGIGLTTDVMVGFPGESDQDFMATYDVLAALPLLNMHVFRYSARPGTPAAVMSGQLAEAVKESRSRALINLAREKHTRFLEGMLEQTWTVLVEQLCVPGIYRALSDNYAEILLRPEYDPSGHLVEARAIRQEDGTLWGELVQPGQG